MAWNGSQIIYNRVVRPVFLRHESTVDNMVNDLSGKAMSAAENLTREGTVQFHTSTHQFHTSIWLKVPPPPFLISSVLSTLMKNKALVTPVAQPEAISLPSSSTETSAAKGALAPPSEDRPVRKHASLHREPVTPAN